MHTSGTPKDPPENGNGMVVVSPLRGGLRPPRGGRSPLRGGLRPPRMDYLVTCLLDTLTQPSEAMKTRIVITVITKIGEIAHHAASEDEATRVVETLRQIPQVQSCDVDVYNATTGEHIDSVTRIFRHQKQ